MAEANKKLTPFQQLNKAITRSLRQRSESLDPQSEVMIQGVMADISDQIDLIRSIDKPELWKQVYVNRDAAQIRVEILNRLMSMGGKP